MDTSNNNTGGLSEPARSPQIQPACRPDRVSAHVAESAALDPLNLLPAFAAAAGHLLMNPQRLLHEHLQMSQEIYALWENTGKRLLGLDHQLVAVPEADDLRFRDPAWHENTFFDLLKQSYLLAAQNMLRRVDHLEDLDERTQHKVQFFTRQFVDAVAPTNFATTNPEVLRATAETQGSNLVRGFHNLLRDCEEDGQLRIAMCDRQAFSLGVNIAASPGAVVYQNDMLQLLQYAPATETVFKRPVLIVPPWINKYYILDLQPKNSLVKWLVEQGHTVFVISWVNPDASYADKSFDDYLLDGTLAALDAVRQATGEHQCNAIGYCLGGTLLASTMAHLQTCGEQHIASATYFTTLIDFGTPGELGVFIDEQQIENLEVQMHRDGFLDGKSMSSTFNMLRANDLVWSFFVHNYLLGRDPIAFDLLYWNADSTRMPAAMHSFYLRNMYLRNALREPGGIELAGVGIDISKITAPAYFLSAQEDHIAPWQATFSGAALFAGPVRFVLGESGHIAGVINPPGKDKYGYRTNPAADLRDADAWLQTSEHHRGSWWPDWQRWIEPHAGGQVPQRRPGDGKLKVLEQAPGSYVKGE
ncbi:MAG: class I poly(R)-hydroxyalkanoic acid synthase [Gammaproteobacteria bacterium]|nr:class I poly(R)-hydroxyalkanoic acid synthase [Gammaproteobacteria bacterium]